MRQICLTMLTCGNSELYARRISGRSSAASSSSARPARQSHKSDRVRSNFPLNSSRKYKTTTARSTRPKRTRHSGASRAQTLTRSLRHFVGTGPGRFATAKQDNLESRRKLVHFQPTRQCHIVYQRHSERLHVGHILIATVRGAEQPKCSYEKRQVLFLGLYVLCLRQPAGWLYARRPTVEAADRRGGRRQKCRQLSRRGNAFVGGPS